MKTRIARHVAIYALIALTGYGIGACRQNVMLNPSEDDLVVLNGCVISACNYLAAVKTQLDTAVKNGKLTQAQADKISQAAPARLDKLIARKHK